MHCVRNVTEDLYWVGANDHRLALFENIHPIPRGVSYNAYLLLDEQTVLFDTIDWSECRQLLENLLGLPPGFAAAVGLVAVFCGAVNCPIASVILSIELFGSGGLLYFAMACAVSYLLSGYCGLYSSQTILYSKLRAEFINVHAK